MITIYPTADILPANLLRFHVAFPAPPDLSRLGEAVRLLTAEGRPVGEPFLEVPGGLWDVTGTLLTLCLHPGRVKSGLAAHSIHGPVLQPAHAYRLEVNLAWLLRQTPAASPVVVKNFEVGAPRTNPFSPRTWRRPAIRPFTRHPLRIDFDRPLDRASLCDSFQVLGADGQPWETELRIGSGELSVELTPLHPWPSPAPRLCIAPDLEDVAGNRAHEAFEHVSPPRISMTA